MAEEKNAVAEEQTGAESSNGGGQSEQVNKIIEAVEGLTVLELVELVKALEDKFGVTAAAPVMAAAVPAMGGAGAEGDGGAEEPTEVSVMLTSFGEKKIQVIKVVREITGLGLKEAKDLVDNFPKPVKEEISREDAEPIKTKLEEAGGTVEIK